MADSKGRWHPLVLNDPTSALRLFTLKLITADEAWLHHLHSDVMLPVSRSNIRVLDQLAGRLEQRDVDL